MAGFEELLAIGKDFGIFNLYLPFVLTFAIIYGILAKVKIFGEDKVGRMVNLIVSVILSLFVIGYTPVGITLGAFFGTMFTRTVLTIVTLLGSMMVLYVLCKMAGVDVLTGKSKMWNALIVVLGALLALVAFVYSGGLSFFAGTTVPSVGGISLPALPSISIPIEDWVVFGGVVLFIAAVIYIVREEGGAKK